MAGAEFEKGHARARMKEDNHFKQGRGSDAMTKKKRMNIKPASNPKGKTGLPTKRGSIR